MKKFLSISFSVLILLSGMHFTIANHYCGGKIAATKVSVIGEVASCGMENSSSHCPLPGKHIGSNCCKDKVSAFVVDTNYAPSFSVFNAFSKHILQVYHLPASFTVQSNAVSNHNVTNVSPPGNFWVSDVSLPDICVFRI
jgi:hypothetical protein